MKEIESLLGKGAEAEVYLCKFMGEPTVCKRRLKKAYRISILDSFLRRERTKKEACIMHEAKEAGVKCPLLKHVDLTRKEIYMECIEGTLLRETFDKLEKNERKRIVKEIGKCLAMLHEKGIVHGDCTTSNIILTNSREVCWIDFGLSEFTKSLEEQATDLLLFKKSVQKKDFNEFVKEYAKNKRESKKVFERLSEIESRGRYVVRAMANEGNS